MTNTVRVGVIGTSWYAAMLILPSLHSHPQVELAALCGRDQARALAVAAEYHIPGVFGDYREMIARGGLDAVVVVAPDDLHYEMTMQALNAGLHVQCDKPLALDAGQARAMYAKAQATGLKNLVMFTYRWIPAYRYVHDLLAQGYVGRCYHCEFHYQMGYARQPDYLWRFDPRRANGILGDLGVHMIDMARWLVGDIHQVEARLSTFVQRAAPDGGVLASANDSAIILAEFANGAQGLIQASGVAHLPHGGFEQQVRLYGEAGSLEIDIPNFAPGSLPVIRGARHDEKQFQTLEVPSSYWGPVSRLEPMAIFTQQSAGCRAFIDAILADRPAEPSFYDGYQAQQVIEAALAADRSGCQVTIQNLA